MTCDQAREAFSDLHDGVLSGAPLAALSQHLEGCPACQAEWVAFRRAIQALGDLGSAEPSPGFAERVRRRMASPPWWQQLLERLFLPLRVKVPIQAMALVLLAFAGTMLYLRSAELRRQAEHDVVSPPPVAREAPITTPAPAAPRKAGPAAKEAGDPKPRPDAAPSPAAPPPADRAVREAEHAGSSTEDLARRPRESLARAPDPGAAAQRLQQSAPAPAESGGALLRVQPPLRSVAPLPSSPTLPEAPARAREERLSSIPSGSADELFSAALMELERQSYNRGMDALRAFIAQHPRDPRAPEARLRLADAYFAQQRYAEAVPEYEALARQFPDSPLVPKALYGQAQARLALGDRAGCRVLRDVTDRYPQAPEAAPARSLLTTRCP